MAQRPDSEGTGAGAGGEKSGVEAMRKLRHDLSNPLAAVLAETQLLLLAPDELSPDVLSSLKQIEALARKMRQMLQDFDV
jgi:signal transduction histidine kinase